MQWLSVWLQETNFPYPGPKCQDGRLLRAARMERSLCTGVDIYGNERTDGNHLPLLNEHGDVFQRDLPEDFNDECEANEGTRLPGDRPLVGESEYFYDQYVDAVRNAEQGQHIAILGGHLVRLRGISVRTDPRVGLDDLTQTIVRLLGDG